MSLESKNIRKKILLERDKLSSDEQISLSNSVISFVEKLDILKNAKTVFIYVNFRSEVRTSELIDIMLDMGKSVVVPVTLPAEKDLLPVRIENREKDLRPGYASIPEPLESIRVSGLMEPGKIDIMFIPGSVFDERGGRMGYGGGFYDRFVSARAPEAIRVGLAYELQVVKEAPLQDHDELMDLIITEKRIISSGRKGRRIEL